MKTLEILKKDAKTGYREVGVKFQAPKQAADVWIGLGLVKDVHAPVKKVVKKVVKTPKSEKPKK